jgi:hypothetical protein
MIIAIWPSLGIIGEMMLDVAARASLVGASFQVNSEIT